MKKALLLLCALVALSAAAQKSFITIFARNLNSNYQELRVNGKLPDGIKSAYYVMYDDMNLADLMTLLSEKGYAFEQMTTAASPSTADTYSSGTLMVLMSKPTGQTPGAIETITSDDEATEIARYNLQGQPISENTPGIQIIVYSNYTTRIQIHQ